MFAYERLPDYKANLDDILHVGNASDATPDSFLAQENFLSQLENEVWIQEFFENLRLMATAMILAKIVEIILIEVSGAKICIKTKSKIRKMR